MVSYWEMLLRDVITENIPNSTVTIHPKAKSWINKKVSKVSNMKT